MSVALYPAAYAVFEAAAADDGAGPAQDLEALVVEVSFFKCRVQRVTMKANCWMVVQVPSSVEIPHRKSWGCVCIECTVADLICLR